MEEVIEIDATTVNKWFENHYEELSRYAFSMMKSQEEAEDIVQKLFVKLWEKRKELEVTTNIRAYLYRSTYNSCLNELKRLKKMRNTELNTEIQIQTMEDTSSYVVSAELKSRMEQAMDSLPEKCGEVFRLSRAEELSYKEISECLDISIKTVENHMGKALRLMRKALEEYLPICIVTILLLTGW